MVGKKRLSYAEIAVILLVVAVLLAVLVPMVTELRHGSRRYACVENLKQLGLALNLYSKENKDRYPPIDNTKNNFMFDANVLYPEYLTDHMAAVCPADPRWDPDTNFRLIADHPIDGTSKGEVHADCLTDSSYVYLGWMVMRDEEVKALFHAYDKLSPAGYDTNIVVPVGSGTVEEDTLYRMEAGVDRFLITNSDSLDLLIYIANGGYHPIISVVWDRPHLDTAKFGHRPVGGNVLFLDGHVEYIRLLSKSPTVDDEGLYTFSFITETMARLLEERPRVRIPGCDE